MKLCITGLNHRTAPVEVRERLAFDKQSLPAALQELKRIPGLQEGVILSTCNRVEVAVTASDDADPQGRVEEFLARQRELEPHVIRPYVYSFLGRDAIRHLFRVAASLDSMVVGEPQILGQLKAAYTLAKTEGTVNGFLDNVITRAFSVAKRVRTETEIGSSAVSVSYAAVELAREIFGSLASRKVMLIGAGKMSELAARHLARSGVGQVLVTNRTLSRAEELAGAMNGTIVPYEEFYHRLPEVDIVITSSGAPTYLLRKDQMRRIVGARRNRPMFLIDIAVPRNIEPAVNELDNVFLYDIDDLQRVVERNLRGRLDEAAEADKIVAEEVDRLETWLRARQAGPLIATLQEQLERVRVGELERLRGKLGALSEQQEEAIEALTRGIVNKIAHGPIAELRREAGAPEGSPVIDLIRRIFKLDRN
ncbi:MAG TPA: glutamyl-tRNA reductase [Bryobacteraceae bacterium]|nr:glutamyl-tRNA reductase [Bryobacteraceae bacterium]